MSPNSSPGQDPVSVSKGNSGLGCLVAFGLLFAVIGFGLFGTQFVFPAYQVFASKSWSPTPCIITSTQIKTHSGDSTSYSFEVTYIYTFAGLPYTGDRYGFGQANTNWTEVNARSTAFPNNARSTCYVNPSNPSSAVLYRDMTGEIWKSLMTLIFAGFGLLFAGIGVFAGRAKNAKRADWRPKGVGQSNLAPEPTPIPPLRPFESGPFSSLETSSRGSGAVEAVPSPSNGSPVVLKPRYSPAGKFWGGVFVSVFWNGIVSVFVFQAIKDFMRGGANFMTWFMVLFMIPFVLVGLGILAFTAGQFLALFNAKATVTASRGSIAPGQPLDVSWTFGGGLFFPKEVIVTLEGLEEATYRRGTDTVTDKSTFFLETLYNSAQESMARNQASITLPVNTMHSIEAANNKIVWVLKLQGTIKGWPDISDEYPIVVTPAPPR